MTDIVKTLQTLNAAFGPAGEEIEIASVIARLARPYVDEITTDTLGNLICHKKGTGPKVMFAAHMDSIGLIVHYIEKEGFLRAAPLGGVTPADVLYTKVRFQNGVKGIVAVNEGVEAGKVKADNIYIDIGVTSKEEAEELVKVGDRAVYDTQVAALGSCLAGPYLDNRIYCTALLKAMEELSETENDLYFVFTSQEELGLRGAATAAYGIDPVYGIAVDVTISSDIPATKHGCSSEQGKGAAIKVMDSSVICHPRMVKKLEKLAKEQGIPYQMDVIRSGGTDAGAMQKSRAGVYAGGISIPCRYLHTPNEMVRTSDVEACVALIRAFAETKLEKE